jgi:malonate-semialdehyde dehydrogenase (acetylating)/methylmalonate-semialdehyde dehydrogenase
MVPMWMFPIAHRLRQHLRPEAVRARSVGVAAAGRLLKEAGLPDGVFNVVNGDKEAVDAILEHPGHQGGQLRRLDADRRYIYETGARHGKRVQALGGAKNHMIVMPDADMDQAADALMGAGYGSAGERCMAISVAVPVGDDRRRADRQARAARARAQDRPGMTDPTRHGPAGHEARIATR